MHVISSGELDICSSSCQHKRAVFLMQGRADVDVCFQSRRFVRVIELGLQKALKMFSANGIDSMY